MEKILIASAEQAKKLFPPNSIKLVRIGNKHICITRIGEKYFAFESKCPHMDHPLQSGKVSGTSRVVCTWHNYSFDLQSGKESENRCRNLLTFSLEMDQQGLWVTL